MTIDLELIDDNDVLAVLVPGEQGAPGVAPAIEVLNVVSSAASIASSTAGKKYSLTTATTAAFTLNITLPAGAASWDAEVIITTTQAPVSFSFGGSATKRDVPGSTLADNAFETGKVTVLKLSKLSDGNYTAQFTPAIDMS